jgi:hypothetical protein
VAKSDRRVSLAEVSERAEGVLRRAKYDEFDASAPRPSKSSRSPSSSRQVTAGFGSTISGCSSCIQRPLGRCGKS